jgi:translation initiation factor 1
MVFLLSVNQPGKGVAGFPIEWSFCRRLSFVWKVGALPLEKPSHKTVYSSDSGRICPKCCQPIAGCICGKNRTASPKDGVVRVGRQTRGRKGKGVTLVAGVPLDGLELADLAKQLKNSCGAGGTVKEGVIEIQGDHRDRLVAELRQRGWTVKRSGG